MIQLIIGDGKGKTTAAVGQAIRALGWNNKVLFAQFLKSSETGERKILESLSGITFFRPEMRHKGFIWNMEPQALKETKEDLVKGFEEVSRRILEGAFTFAVLDEVLDVVDCGFLSEDELLGLFKRAPSGIEFILTGRKASDRLLELSDYISRVTKEKHPFDRGIGSRKGIEY